MSKTVLVGPLMFVAGICASIAFPDAAALWRMGGIAAFVAAWWFHPSVPVGIASMLPFILIPLCEIAPASEVSAEYMDPIIFLFLGGFLLSIAIEKSSLHKRLAYFILSKTAHSEQTVLAGIMLASFLVSMWISNTATMLMFLAASLAIIQHWLKTHPLSNLAPALLLGVAYAANIGGMSTLVGTPTNMIFAAYYANAVQPHADYPFLKWMMQAFPIALLLLVFCYFLLRKKFALSNTSEKETKVWFRDQYRSLGGMSGPEKLTLLIFASVAALWVSRMPVVIGSVKIPGWSDLFKDASFVTDGSIAILGASLLFLIPPAGEKKPLLSWDDAQKIPLDILLLFGGGFALAKGFESSGLGDFLAVQLAGLHQFAPAVSLLIILCLITCISEFASNVASIQLMLPVLLPLSASLGVHPVFLMVPATLAASLGFMLPIATASNTIAFSSGFITTRQMAGAGIWMNLAGILAILIAAVLFY